MTRLRCDSSAVRRGAAGVYATNKDGAATSKLATRSSKEGIA